MGNVNKVFLMGNLTRDPELRYTPSGTPVCEWGMAINRTYSTRDGEQREETCFVDCSMWGRRGVVVSEYFSKGSPIFIEGRLQYDSWETDQGRRSKLKVVAENFEFIGGSGGGQGGGRARSEAAGGAASGGGRSGGNNQSGQGRQQRQPEEETYDVGEDEIPF